MGIAEDGETALSLFREKGPTAVLPGPNPDIRWRTPSMSDVINHLLKTVVELVAYQLQKVGCLPKRPRD